MAGIAVHVLAARPSLSWLWGAHFYAFFPPVLLYGATLLLATSMLIIVLREERTAARMTSFLARTLSGRRLLVMASVAVVAGTALFWVARICHSYLGDGNTIVQEIDTKHELLEREPLTSLLQYLVYGIAKPWFFAPDRSIEDVAFDAVAVGSVGAGLMFLVAAWLLADELVRLRPVQSADEERRPFTALVWLILVAQGYVQLFFGYVENYSFYAVGVVVYLWLCLRCLRGACPLLFPALALFLCFALHLSSIVLGASFLAIAVPALSRRDRRRAAIRDLAIVAGVAAATAFVFSSVRQGYNPLSTLLDMTRTAFSDRRNVGYMFSGVHYRDFLNEQILIGPLGMFLFIAAVITAKIKEDGRSNTAVFFLLAGVGFLVACWMIGDSNLGYARDWDLVSHAGIAFTTAALGLFLSRRARHSVVMAALLCALLLSIYHTAPWIATNANADRSLARLQTLPLGQGRTEVTVAMWYRHEGDETKQREWLERAIAVNPQSVNAYYLLGTLALKQQRYESAIVSFERAIALRPDKVLFHGLVAQAYNKLNRLPDALPHLEFIVRMEPGNATTTMFLGEALVQAGRPADAQPVFAQAERLYRTIIIQSPDDSAALTNEGWVLFRLGRFQESLASLEKAEELNARSLNLDCYLGYVLRDLGRNDEARGRFETCLTLNPDFPNRGEVEAWLSGFAP